MMKKQKYMQGHAHGFSLVELSIVLVILGLLVGGVLGGQSLIRAAELRSVLKEVDEYTTAVYTFRNKYHALPGDMPNATRFWGSEPAANCPGDDTTPSTTTATCNGNGNGNLSWSGAPGLGAEVHRFWQHLANAGLVNGQFSGTHSAGSCMGGCNVELGLNAPHSRVSGAGWTAYHIGQVDPGHHYYFPGSYGNVFLFGRVLNYTSAAALKPEEAWNIDSKVDDGKPGLGWVRPWNNTHDPSCTDSNLPQTASYQLSQNALRCQLLFMMR